MTTTTDTQFTIIARNINTDRNFFWDMNRKASEYSEGLVITGRDGRKMASFKIPGDVEFVHDTESRIRLRLPFPIRPQPCSR